VGGELWETNPCFFVWFDSLSCFSSLITFASASIYLGVLLVCAGIITLLVFINKGYTPSSVRARSQEVLEVVFAGVLCYTGLTGVTCEVQCLAGLTGHHHRSDRWSTVSSSVWGERV
jgi:uncharacterized membrane protein HdeD (DUF308 family)